TQKSIVFVPRSSQPKQISSVAGGPGQTNPPATDEICFGCDDLGTNTIDFWVQDVNGNWDYVATTISVQDNMNACGNVLYAISGGIETENAATLAGAEVSLSGNASNMPAPQITGNDGTYGFQSLEANQNYEVTPYKNDDFRNGLSANDIVVTSRHLIGIELLDSPYKLIAADVDNSQGINTFDLIAMQRMILFIDTEFANNTSWRFVGADHVFANPQNPWTSPFPEVASFNNLQEEEVANFISVKIGDVTGNAVTNATGNSGDRSFKGSLKFLLDDVSLEAGEEYVVDFKASEFEQISGYQFTLNFQRDAMEIVDVEAGELSGLGSENFGLTMIDEGVITTLWGNSNAATLADDAVVFSVKVKAKRDTRLSEALSLNSRYTVAEAYDADLELLNPDLEYRNNTQVSSEFALYQNQPNPFVEETVIGFHLPEAGEVKLSVYDVSGKVLKVIEGEYAAGYNQVSVTRNELGTNGVLYYQVDTKNDSATRKMIIIE
ncbi:MAG: cohesin domain-containing protein, partial [Bacteroidota bacterium]